MGSIIFFFLNIGENSPQVVSYRTHTEEETYEEET